MIPGSQYVLNPPGLTITKFTEDTALPITVVIRLPN